MESDNWWLTPKPLPIVRITAEDIRLMIKPMDPTTFTDAGRVSRNSIRDSFRISDLPLVMLEDE